MVRQFRIQGIDTGVSYSLNDFNKYLLTLPQGLGFEFKNTFINVGNQRVLVDKEYQFKEINGTIEVSGNTRLDWENNYNELKSFIVKNKKSGFKLYYKSSNDAEKYILCNIRLLTKTEKTTYGLLIPIALEPRSLWEKDYTIVSEKQENIINNENIVSFSEQEDGTYSFVYKQEIETGEYNAKYLNNLAGKVELINDGDDEIPLKIILKSECVNPIMILRNVNDSSDIDVSRIFVVLHSGDVLTLNSEPENLSIKIVRSTGIVEDVTKNIDISEKTFLTLPVGSYILEITDDNGNYVDATIEMSKRYLGG